MITAREWLWLFIMALPMSMGSMACYILTASFGWLIAFALWGWITVVLCTTIDRIK